MAKTCPSCGYRPIGPFTDNCPMCAEPVRNVRSDAAGGSGPWSWLRWVLLAAVIVVVGVLGCCGLMTWQFRTAVEQAQKDMERMQAERDADRKARTVVVTATDLLKEFQDDPAAADKKYAGKYLEVTGVVERSGRGRYDQPFVILKGGDENTKFKVECFFDLSDSKDAAQRQAAGQGRHDHGPRRVRRPRR